MSQQINEIVNKLVDAIKRNQIDEAEIIYNQLEELVGEKVAEELFSKIEIILLED
jgi:F0F1-type ATP synthase gamma subunit